MAKTIGKQIIKKWLIISGGFIFSQLLFMLIDGTVLEPHLNNTGHWIVNKTRAKLEWITLYSSPFLKIVTIIFVLTMTIVAISDIVVRYIPRNKDSR